MNRAQGRLSRTFVSGTGVCLNLWFGDGVDYADDRDDDQKFDQREAFLAFVSHAKFLLLKRLGVPKLLAPSAFVHLLSRAKREVSASSRTTVVPCGIWVNKGKFRSFLIEIFSLEGLLE
jgi:hypothetical protein